MTTTTATIEAPTTTTIRTPGWAGAFAGLIGAAVALGVSELIAGVLSPGSSLIAAVGQTIIDLQPPGAKDFVVALFGTNDKLALEVLVTGTHSRSGHCSAISAGTGSRSRPVASSPSGSSASSRSCACPSGRPRSVR